MSSGTSPIIGVDNPDFKARKGMKLSPAISNGQHAMSPSPTGDGTTPSVAMYRYQNKYRDFAFQKITPPDYGYSSKSVARVTGVPANEPDFIADYHFIALMRCIDDMLQHGYVGYISGSWNTPKPTT